MGIPRYGAINRGMEVEHVRRYGGGIPVGSQGCLGCGGHVGDIGAAATGREVGIVAGDAPWSFPNTPTGMMVGSHPQHITHNPQKACRKT